MLRVTKGTREIAARKLPWFMCLFALFSVAASPISAGLPNSVCADCHDEVVEAFSDAPRGVYFNKHAGLSEQSCESCHGSGAEHVESGGDADLIINPARHDQFGGKELCMSCHDGHQFDEWAFSSHNGAGMSCGDCHQIHVGPGESLKKSSPDLCYDCHSNVEAAWMMPSHHPVAEGKLECKDCHSIHGGPTARTLDNTGRELCFSCHADKEGPFVYEHSPVSEDCSVCHTPHGSVADNLLKQAEPALCLSCHPMHFHGTVEGVEGPITPPQAPGRATISTRDGFKRGMLTKCTQCHTEIHGSDMPSQTISTGGAALTR